MRGTSAISGRTRLVTVRRARLLPVGELSTERQSADQRAALAWVPTDSGQELTLDKHAYRGWPPCLRLMMWSI